MKDFTPSAPKRRSPVAFIVVSIFYALSAACQSSAQQLAPSPLITQTVNESQLTVLKGNTHPLARPEFDLGTAAANVPMQRMLLVLKRSVAQESALRQLLDNQQDKSSPSYHKWLTPSEFGRQFGPTDADIQTITSWLESHGFQVGTTKGRSVLEFSGSAGQVQETFHTAIHKYVISGEQHWANSSDPSIPTALTPAVAGVLTLHNFISKPQIHFSPQPVAAKITSSGRGRRPQVTFPAQNGQPTTYALGPQDYATIYNINPVYNSGIDGYTITVGVVGRSNLYNNNGLGDSGEDVGSFLSLFNLASSDPTVILNGPDPGDLGGSEEAEATLDTTWSAALASFANIDFVVSATTNTTDGIDLSEVYIVENNLTDIMTESFSTCEYYATDAQIVGVAAVAEQAAAQGISYFVSAGDDGAEGCDDQDTETIATGPLSVNLLASTPYTTAVGGTVFNENGQDAKYWTNSAPISESAISYIPEDVWNASCLASECGSTASIWAGSGGVSSGNIGSGGTTPGFAKPTWQSGVMGIPNDGFRDLPDVSLTAAGHDPYILCLEGSCFPDSQGDVNVYLVWGTSASAPSFAGIMALVDQQMANAQGPRQGQANYVLYRLAASQNTSLSLCNASNTATLPASTCIFNDITVGNNAVPGEINYGSASAEYQAGVGYDMATGLGSVNVANLVNQWNSVTFSPTTTVLNITYQNVMHGSSVPFTVLVSPASGTGIPTGDVSLLAAPQAGGLIYDDSLGMFSLNATGSIASSTSNIPGGAYFVAAYYAGDATYAPSFSSLTPMELTPEPSATTLSVLTFSSNGTQSNFTSGPFGSFVYLRADVAGASGHGTPTGGVTFTDSFGPIPGGGVYQLNSGDPLNSGGNTATPNGVITFDTGTHAISASYSGDASFNPSTSIQPLSFTIQPGFFATVPLNQSTVTISAPGSSGSSSVSVTSSTSFSGKITLSCSGLPSGAACVFSPSSIITANGTPTTTSSTITVTTAAATAAMLDPPQRLYLKHWPAMAGSLFFSLVVISIPRRRRSRRFLLVALALIVSVPGCGGGGSGSGVSNQSPPPQPGTATGTYTVVVTAASGTTSSATGFTLLVQ